MRSTLVPALVLALAGLLTACGGGDGIDDADRDRAAEAAVAAAGGGTAVRIDRGDDDELFAFEVEVDRGGGDEVDVRLDEDFQVVGEVPAAAPSAGAATTPPTDAASPSTSAGTPRSDDDDRPLTGEVLARASAAAIEAVGGQGRVIEAHESDDRSHAYEVEVRLPDGEDVDVDLAEDFSVVDIDR